MNSVSPPPDPSIIHVATSDMTPEQTKQWAELLTSREGRERVLDWLMINDPAIRRLYNTLSLSLDIDEGDQHLAAVLVLTKGLYSGPDDWQLSAAPGSLRYPSREAVVRAAIAAADSPAPTPTTKWNDGT